MLKLVVFDCDGVLFESRETNRHYYNDLLAAFGRPAMNETELDYVHMHNVAKSIAYIFKDAPPETMTAVDDYRRQLDYTPYLGYMIMEPDLLGFLAIVRPRYKLAISTNRTDTMGALLHAFELEGYFDMVVTARDVAAPKPAPEALEKILDTLGCLPDEALYIGDSSLDQYHAEAAGVPFIAFRNDALNADYHVSSFTEILGLPPLNS